MPFEANVRADRRALSLKRKVSLLQAEVLASKLSEDEEAGAVLDGKGG